MRFAIHIEDMTQAELAAVTSFITSLGASPVGRTVAELAAATGAAPAAQQPQSPPPAPPYHAPQPGVPNVPNMPAAPGLDSRGLPHNPLFHAESKRVNADGSWAKRKGVDKAACEAWEASMIAGRQHPTPPVTTPAASPANAQSSPSAAEINAKFAPGLPPQGAGGMVPQGDPFAAPVSPPAPPPPPPAPPADVTYGQWHSMYISLMTAGKISPEKYAEIAERHGGKDDPLKFMNDAAARAASYREFQALAA